MRGVHQNVTAAGETAFFIGPHTVEEWRDAPESTNGSRLQLIWGYWHVSPAPTPIHQNACSWIWRILYDAIEGSGRKDLHAIQAVAVEISTAMRYGLIPDIGIVNQPLTTASSFPPRSPSISC